MKSISTNHFCPKLNRICHFQDKEIEMLRGFESDWKRRHDALQWQVTELEQQMVSHCLLHYYSHTYHN